jgi:hypothetical protein
MTWVAPVRPGFVPGRRCGGTSAAWKVASGAKRRTRKKVAKSLQHPFVLPWRNDAALMEDESTQLL